MVTPLFNKTGKKPLATEICTVEPLCKTTGKYVGFNCQSGAVPVDFNTRPATPIGNFVSVVEPVAYNKSPAVYEVMFVPPRFAGTVVNEITVPETLIGDVPV